MAAKYNVGDKVRIIGKRGEGWNHHGAQDKYMNTVMTVRENNVFGIDVLYFMEEDKNENLGLGFMWSEGDFVGKVEDEPNEVKKVKPVDPTESAEPSKFKVGDTVRRINSDNNYYDGSGRVLKVGTVGTVVDFDRDGDIIVKVGNTIYDGTSNENFVLVKEDKIVITHDGKTTTATLYRADGTKETATARCAPEDKFDFKVGAKLAMERLTYEPPVEEEPLYNGKVVCVTCNPGNKGNYTVGKIYQFTNGRLVCDDGSLIPMHTKIHSCAEFNAFSAAGFVEIVE